MLREHFRFVDKLDLQSINKYKTTTSERKKKFRLVFTYYSVVNKINKVT